MKTGNKVLVVELVGGFSDSKLILIESLTNCYLQDYTEGYEGTTLILAPDRAFDATERARAVRYLADECRSARWAF